MTTKAWPRIHFSPNYKPLSNGDRRDAGIGVALSEWFTSWHGQLFIVRVERLDLCQRHIFHDW